MARSALACGVLAALVAAAIAVPTFDRKPAAGGENYAIVVAGSRTWGNYRHQADACHAYQILKEHGVPEKNIITMMFDDIAQNAENPTKGVIINHPNGKDVYGGVKIDYKGEDVTPKNFLAVLTGDKDAVSEAGTGRVLESGPNDNVFINFVDHGGPQIIAFPTDLLHAKDLVDALKTMHTKSMYSELVFYMEACESGSMFDNLLPTDLNIYAQTASDPTHSSYACYFDNKLRTYLGDVYSVNWMENTDASNVEQETITEQYAIVKKKTNTSHVMQYGTQTFTSEVIGKFLGSKKASTAPATPRVPIVDAVDSRDVPVEILRRSIKLATSGAERTALRQKLNNLVAHRASVLKTYASIVERAAGLSAVNKHLYNTVASQEFACVKSTINTFHATCVDMTQDDYALKFSNSLVSMCDSGIEAEAINAAIRDTCTTRVAFEA